LFTCVLAFLQIKKLRNAGTDAMNNKVISAWTLAATLSGSILYVVAVRGAEAIASTSQPAVKGVS
jgi:hypothetical protein